MFASFGAVRDSDRLSPPTGLPLTNSDESPRAANADDNVGHHEHASALGPRVMCGQLGQGEPRMRSTVVMRRKPGTKCSSTSEFTVPFVVSGRFLSPST